nr:glycosyltransferase [Methanolinea mesophila]
MQYVYKGYNKGITSASGDIVVLVNSDNCFSPDWLENLLKYLGPDSIITSHLVERNHPEHGIFPDASYCDFGNSPKNFDETGFLKFVEQKKVTGLTKGGAYMPCAVFKKNAIKVGLYPEGNLAGKSFKDVVEFGDQNFYRKLSNIGVQHFTSLDSIVYHFKEGEKDEDVPIVENSIPLKRYYKQPNYFPLKSIKIQNLDNYEFLTVDNTPIFFKIMKNNFISLKNFFNSAIIKMKNF